MKTAILTQPLHNNYGGILQAWALQKVLKQLGYHAILIQFCKMQNYHSFEMMVLSIKRFIKNCIKIILGRKWYTISNHEQDTYIRQNTKYFIDKYITPITPLINSPSELRRYCDTSKFDAYIVGSDQVWRPIYSPKISNFFLDFTKDKLVKRVAYAASFGTEQWEFSVTDTKKCAKLAQKFDAISVREDSGIKLCRKHLGVDAIQVLDPTLLLEKNFYEELVTNENEPQRPGNLFCYVLDKGEAKDNLIKTIANRIGMIPFTTMPAKSFSTDNYKKNKAECVYPTVTAWLRSFMDAEFVLTDSFHGCVFSIIFNKPFVALGNASRGQSRFTSLLNLFGLENRLCTTEEDIMEAYQTPIDWDSVNQKKTEWKDISIQFLKKIHGDT